MPSFTRNRKRLGSTLTLSIPGLGIALLLLTLAVPQAHAAMQAGPDCATDGSSFYCRLLGILHILYGVAAILGVLLMLIAAFAYAAYRRNQKRRLDETDRP